MRQNPAPPAALFCLLAADGNYAMPLATTLRSLVESNARHWPIKVRVLCADFPLELRERVAGSLPAGCVQLDWHEIDLASFTAFGTMPGVSHMTYARLMIPQAVEADVERVLYLDSDILVLGDLEPLWRTGLEGKAIAAVEDTLSPWLTRQRPVPHDMPRVKRYFNAGMMLVDMDRWRASRISQQALGYLQANPHTRFSDQDGLNVACDGEWQPVDARWNFQGHLDVQIEAMPRSELPQVVHFVTAYKPWGVRHSNPNARLYSSFRDRTLFRQTFGPALRDATLRAACRLRHRLGQVPALRQLHSSLKTSSPEAAAK